MATEQIMRGLLPDVRLEQPASFSAQSYLMLYRNLCSTKSWRE